MAKWSYQKARTPCRSLVSPLSTAPRDQASQRNSSCFDVLERSKKNSPSPITCQKCHSCQVNKGRQLKYGKLPTKLAITKPWEALCVDLIGPYTLKGKDKTQIDFMCVTMINPETSWFKIVELPVSQLYELDIPTGTKGQRSKDTHVQTKQPYFDKSSATVGTIINRT
eukprot:CCRYP_020070-RA/>CCRYP_020070-RA protein AED:0.09 eAED:0.09 QI:538/1/1/1/0/0/2/134/167